MAMFLCMALRNIFWKCIIYLLYLFFHQVFFIVSLNFLSDYESAICHLLSNPMFGTNMFIKICLFVYMFIIVYQLYVFSLNTLFYADICNTTCYLFIWSYFPGHFSRTVYSIYFTYWLLIFFFFCIHICKYIIVLFVYLIPGHISRKV